MGWFKTRSDNELGEYLPNSEAQSYEQSEPIQAYNQNDADQKCEKIAEAYGGTKAKAERTGKGQYDCKFKLWGLNDD